MGIKYWVYSDGTSMLNEGYFQQGKFIAGTAICQGGIVKICMEHEFIGFELEF